MQNGKIICPTFCLQYCPMNIYKKW